MGCWIFSEENAIKAGFRAIMMPLTRLINLCIRTNGGSMGDHWGQDPPPKRAGLPTPKFISKDKSYFFFHQPEKTGDFS